MFSSMNSMPSAARMYPTLVDTTACSSDGAAATWIGCRLTVSGEALHERASVPRMRTLPLRKAPLPRTAVNSSSTIGLKTTPSTDCLSTTSAADIRSSSECSSDGQSYTPMHCRTYRSIRH